jgi:hypothetical protein
MTWVNHVADMRGEIDVAGRWRSLYRDRMTDMRTLRE